MLGDRSSFVSRRLGGVRHAPEADIESIRDLLRGYGSPWSILKELIQNAEDAEASRMDVLYVPGDSASPHSLLRGPGLLIANDGRFTEEDRDAITQINLGTKGTEDRAIGRFGKGLKSVFAWCEAFFIIARTDSKLGWPETLITDFFNPWHGWRHSDWDGEFERHGDILVSKVEQCLADIYPAGKSWLAFWFPLRGQAQAKHANTADEWIFQLLPGDDTEFFAGLASELRVLTPSLVSLRSLQKIAIVGREVERCDSLILDFPPQSQRIPAPDTEPGSARFVSGVINLRAGDDDTRYDYCGFAGRLGDDRIINLKSAGDWPRVVQRTRGQNSASHPVKGEPHFATLITSRSIDDNKLSGSLDVRWCVFFPVGKQPPGVSQVRLDGIGRHITINLHGFFFLDSERLRVDGLEERFSPNGTTSSKSCLEWNRIVATDGSLTQLPGALEAFTKHESFTDFQCHELAGAIRETWTWSTFHEAICRQETWRPRWRSGIQTWECVRAETPVLLIPNVSDAHEILIRIPQLGPISENETLVALGADGSLPGLHNDRHDRWSERLVLHLFKDVRLEPTGDEKAVEWINQFLDHLRADEALTPATLNQVSALPLLTVKDPRTKSFRRISTREWSSLNESGRLFGAHRDTEYWLGFLCEALPDWSCHVVIDGDLPQWFTEPRPPVCDGTMAARTVLMQTNLGSFIHRAKLVEAFASFARRDSGICLAMRFLMHGNAPHAREDTKILFMPSTQQGQQVWSRLIEQLLKNDGGADSWRLLPTEWASVLSQHLQQELRVSTVDSNGAWQELMKGQVDFHALDFAPDQWSDNDICALLQGLYQAGESRQEDTLALLRKLRLHTLRSQPNERVSVANDEGQLGAIFVLNTLEFETGIPADLQPLWQRFLAETKIVERLPQDNLAFAVQQHVFQWTEGDGAVYSAELDWNYVVRRSLEAANPAERAPLILEALRYGDQVARGVGQKLRKTAWLPLALGGSIAPDSVMHIEGLEDDFHRLLDPTKDGLAGIRALPDWVRNHAGFTTLHNYLPRIEQAFEHLGLWLEDKQDWHLGLTIEFQPADLESLLSELEDLENLPAASLLAKLQRVRIRGHEEGLFTPLQEFILPAVMKRFDYKQGGCEKIETILRGLQGRQSRGAFDTYLSQACRDGVLEAILPNLFLVNQRGQWISARQLIWPSTNLDPAAQLCTAHAEILAALHHEHTTSRPQPGGNQQVLAGMRSTHLTKEPDFDAQAAKLSEYLQPFRIGNVGENLPAALVAILGGHPKTQELLRELLQAGLRQEPADFIIHLLGEERNNLAQAMQSERFLIEIVRGRRTEVRTITGEKIMVELTSEISTLLVGDPADLWWHYFYQSRKDTACHLLRLRWIEHPDELLDPVAVFASTIETILLQVYCNARSELCPTNLKEVLGNIADAGQADLRRSRSFLLDMAEARLKELGVKDVPWIDGVLKKFAEARQSRVDAEMFATRAPARAQQRTDEARKLVEAAKRELVDLLETTQENTTRRRLVEAIQRKMTDFQYSVGSIAFELFQNADDAVAELEEMQKNLGPKEQQFVLHLDSRQRVLQVVHWGRPINRHEYPGFVEGLKRGYDQDLQKMLTLNFSEKGLPTDDRPVFVTGRFGLGFKSVFFVSEQPEVVSGRLAFEIRGGFFPVPLPQAVAEEMRNNAVKLSGPGLVPTAVRLKWAEHIQADEVAKAIDSFVRVAPLLTIFSRRINTLIITCDDTTKTWTNVEEPLTESGRASHVQIGNMNFLCFRCPLRSDERPATVLFQLDPSGISRLSDDLTGLWITTPTAEHSDLRWAINAPFKPDAGRQRLPLNNSENRKIAEEVAHIWGEALIELFDETSRNWGRVAQHMGLHSDANFESWWQQFWRETSRSSSALHWEDIREGGQLLNWIAWGKSTGAMRWLVHKRAAIPSELPGHYVKMVRLDDVRFCISGLLAETANGCFTRVAQWESMQKIFPPGQTVHADIGTFLQNAECVEAIVSVTLERVLAAEVGPQGRVNQQTGERLGLLITECRSVFEPTTSHAVEIEQLLNWMKQIALLAKDGAYRLANELICDRVVSGIIERDEALRAAFAPDSAVLSNHYSDTALRFFIKARPQLNAPAATLATWARDASAEQLPGVFKYLIDGELGQQMADQLGRPWLDVNRGTPEWQNLSPEDRSEVERKFGRGEIWPPPPLPPQPPNNVVEQVMPAEEAFCLVSDWWQEQRDVWVSRYEQKTYPLGYPMPLPWPGEPDWDANVQPSAQSRWLLLFINAALVPLGFNRIGRDQSFCRFLVSKKWLDVLTTDDSGRLLDALDDYLKGFIQNTEFHFQMRQFIAFYAVSRNLESFLHSLRAAENTASSAAFNTVFSPNANPDLTGTGINAPPLTGLLGIGTCQVLRELYRLARIKNPAGHRFAFTPIRKVRRLCTQLFGIPSEIAGPEFSVMLYSELQELSDVSGMDPTFEKCFDLPLQFLAEDFDLRVKVLKRGFEVESEEDQTLDGAPRLQKENE
jgi:hypothetical protein